MSKKIPSPEYEYDADKMVKAFEQARKDIKAEMYNLFITDMHRANLIALEGEIDDIIKSLNKSNNKTIKDVFTRATREGVARTLLDLGLVEDYSTALKVADFNEVNKYMLKSMVADTQSDLLAITDNMSRRAKAVVRNAMAEQLRESFAKGETKVSNIIPTITKELDSKLKMGIVDAAGRTWNTDVYVKMAVHTKSMEAHREGTRNEALQHGANYGIISSHGAIDACKGYEGSIIALNRASVTREIPYIGDLPRSKIFHPRCKHIFSPVYDLDRL